MILSPGRIARTYQVLENHDTAETRTRLVANLYLRSKGRHQEPTETPFLASLFAQ